MISISLKKEFIQLISSLGVQSLEVAEDKFRRKNKIDYEISLIETFSPIEIKEIETNLDDLLSKQIDLTQQLISLNSNTKELVINLDSNITMSELFDKRIIVNRTIKDGLIELNQEEDELNKIKEEYRRI